MPRNKSSDIILGSVAAFVFIAGLFGTYYFYSQNNQTLAMVNAKKQEIQIIENKINHYPDLLNKLNQLESEEQRLMNFIPDKEGQKEFVWELEELADQYGIKIVQCDIVKDVQHLAKLPQYEVYQWKVALKGDFPSLNNFLAALPKNKRAVMVSELNILSNDPQEKDDKTAAYVLQINLTLDLLSKSVQEKVAK